MFHQYHLHIHTGCKMHRSDHHFQTSVQLFMFTEKQSRSPFCLKNQDVQSHNQYDNKNDLI